MQLIPTPTGIEFQKETDYKGDFIIEPLYPGYGLTVGNSLRRVLLSSIPGAAITSVKITGVDHEFSALPYVKEDIVDVILNIKQVHLAIDGEVDPAEPLKIILKKTGEGKVTAGDFTCPTQVTVANKNLHLATLTDKAASLEMECVVERGLGYIPTENRPAGNLDLGHIAVDAIYTPINHVNFRTENVRVGEMTNWDKLIISLETDGTITCLEAFSLAVHILQDQANTLVALADNQGHKKAKAVAAVEQQEATVAAIDASSNEFENEELTAEDKAKKKRGRPKKEDK